MRIKKSAFFPLIGIFYFGFLTISAVSGFSDEGPSSNHSGHQAVSPDSSREETEIQCVIKSEVEQDADQATKQIVAAMEKYLGVYPSETVRAERLQDIRQALIKEMGKLYAIVDKPEDCPKGMTIIHPQE